MSRSRIIALVPLIYRLGMHRSIIIPRETTRYDIIRYTTSVIISLLIIIIATRHFKVS